MALVNEKQFNQQKIPSFSSREGGAVQQQERSSWPQNEDGGKSNNCFAWFFPPSWQNCQLCVWRNYLRALSSFQSHFLLCLDSQAVLFFNPGRFCSYRKVLHSKIRNYLSTSYYGQKHIDTLFFLSKITEMSKNSCISCVYSIYFPCLIRSSMEQFLENSPKLFYFWRTKPHLSKRVLLHKKQNTHMSSSSFPLLQISFLCPDHSTVCYVIVSGEQLHFLSVLEKSRISNVSHLKSCQIKCYFIPSSHTASKKQTAPAGLPKLWLLSHLSGN